MLGGEYPDLLTEWLTATSGRGLRVPPQFLPALLDRARRGRAADPDSSRLGRLVAEAGGPRARWLAGLNPDWNFVAQVAGEDAWRFGDAAQRRGYLSALRARDPGAARELIAASWDAAGAARAVFVSVLADGLSLADEPLLEAALDDRADDVRGWAAFLLASLPGSALGQRMAERAGRCLRMKRDARGRRLLVSPPAECDATMRRDGIMPGGAPPQEQARSLLEVVARAPLDTWTEAFGLDPAQIVAVRSGDWAPLLFTAWARAAVAQRRQDWVAALIGQALSGRPPDKPAEGAALRQLARRADPALGAPGSLPAPEPNAPAAVHDAIRVLRFRHEMLKELDDDHRDG
jgi:hypothetical protein